MDFEDDSTLYECLSIPITSDSDMSNDEYSLPRVKDILDADTFTISSPGKHVNVKNRHDTSDDARTCQTNRYGLKNAQIRTTSKESAERKPLEIQGKKNQFTSVIGDCHSELKDEPAYGELAVSEVAKNYFPSVVDEEIAVRYEAIEDSSSDTETLKDLPKRKRSESRNTVLVCEIEGCGKIFHKQIKFDEHHNIHTGARPFKCPEGGCDCTYARKQHLRRHIAISHESKIPHQECFKCEDCDKVMKNKYCLAKHHYRAHVRKNFKCTECGKTFTKQNHLKSHSFVHTGIEPYRCEYPGCGERFMLPSRVRRHALVHIRGCYTCPNESCGETFDVHNALRNHLATSHPKVCDVCGKTFRHLAQLRNHRKIHDDVREAFFCPTPKCDRYFYAERNLSKHIRDKHEGSTIYQCSICSLRLSTKQKLAHHMALHSPSYKRSYHSNNPRKPRKDKGVSKTDYARLLSGYTGDELDESQPSSTVSEGVQSQVVPEEDESSSDDD
ncbi:transcription factor IIIA-like isoform X3 [Palaemon carinicauda]|uniref:transcription factor IIIA-like isoform X3 n=1 Tax=Palaemon carinicauda TaxID=392227 RepID=UPI0035B61FCF